MQVPDLGQIQRLKATMLYQVYVTEKLLGSLVLTMSLGTLLQKTPRFFRNFPRSMTEPRRGPHFYHLCIS